MGQRIALEAFNSNGLKARRIPGRRAFPSAISATITSVDVRASYNAECNAPGGYAGGNVPRHQSPFDALYACSWQASHFSHPDPGRFRINAGAEIAEENKVFYLARVLERDSGSGSGLGTEHFVVGQFDKANHVR